MKRLCSMFLTLIFALAAASGCLAGTNEEKPPVAYEVKFLLDSEKVLTDKNLLTEEILEAFQAEPNYKRTDVIYLETADRDFINEGWVNRIRWKIGKEYAECTCKKRYPVPGNDEAAIFSVLQRAQADGFDLSDDGYSVEVDWGISGMTLSLSKKASGDYKGYRNLSEFSSEDAAAFFESSMPQEERDWKSSRWGEQKLSLAKKLGPLQELKVKGVWGETGVTLEIFPISEEEIITELSFEADDFATASEIRTELIDFLESKGILLQNETLKTQAFLDACLDK